MKIIAISLIFWIFGVILTFTLFVVMAIVVAFTFPFDKNRRIAHAQCYWWADAITVFNPYWKVTITGRENFDPSKTYVIVANHQSLADIVVLYKARMQFKWVAKDSLFRLPILGWCMILARHIRLERGDFSSIKNVYKEAATWLRGGMSVLFFPEGTRSETGELKDFQNGSFKLAIREKVPVLPVAIKGTHYAIPKGSWVFRTHVPLEVKILPAIDTAHFQNGEFEKLRDTARDMIKNA